MIPLASLFRRPAGAGGQLNQAISSQDTSNVIKTADGGLNENRQPAAQHPRQLAVHAANTGVS